MTSFKMSFWGVAEILVRSKPAFSAAAWYMASMMEATALMVRPAPTLCRSMPAKAISKSRRQSTAMPTRPTSPWASGWSESSPIWVGRSKATFRPVCPWSIMSLKRSLVSLGVPKPVYWRVVHSRLR